MLRGMWAVVDKPFFYLAIDIVYIYIFIYEKILNSS
jgi:hypothetical protein